jgi:hypothetical protein
LGNRCISGFLVNFPHPFSLQDQVSQIISLKTLGSMVVLPPPLSLPIFLSLSSLSPPSKENSDIEKDLERLKEHSFKHAKN